MGFHTSRLQNLKYGYGYAYVDIQVVKRVTFWQNLTLILFCNALICRDRDSDEEDEAFLCGFRLLIKLLVLCACL